MAGPSFAVLAGHDQAAKARLDHLMDLHRHGGPKRVREFLATDAHQSLPLTERDALLVEAVVTLAERGYPRRSTRRDWEDFDRGEDRDEREREARS